MHDANPTPVKLGMTGTFSGRHYRVIGRMVMRVHHMGETYYWNEFNLVTDDGGVATLVYEETENGPQWKFFNLYQQQPALTVVEAENKSLGERIELDGSLLRVSFVGECYVHFIEGQAPEGESLGALCRYFNATSGNKMVVVCWTSDVFEYYRGYVLARGVVANAFGLTGELLPGAGTFPGARAMHQFWTGGSSQGMDPVELGIAILLIGLILLGLTAGLASNGRPAAFARVSAEPPPMAPTGNGTLEGKNCHVVCHAQMEIDEVGLIYTRNEYELTNTDGSAELLIFGFTPGKKDWYLFTPLTPSDPMTPEHAAVLVPGSRFTVAGLDVNVTQLFRASVQNVEVSDNQPVDLQLGEVFYDFTGQAGEVPVMARWNTNGISFYEGTAVAEKDVETGFGSGAGK